MPTNTSLLTIIAESLLSDPFYNLSFQCSECSICQVISTVPNMCFIALIHPIKWTIALPVDATGPAKRQKKTSCIYYRQDRSQSVHLLGGASYFLPV